MTVVNLSRSGSALTFRVETPTAKEERSSHGFRGDHLALPLAAGESRTGHRICGCGAPGVTGEGFKEIFSLEGVEPYVHGSGDCRGTGTSRKRAISPKESPGSSEATGRPCGSRFYSRRYRCYSVLKGEGGREANMPRAPTGIVTCLFTELWQSSADTRIGEAQPA
jgi:hypothetical protein